MSGRADVSRQLQTLFSLGTAGVLTDGELLERFASRRGAAAEAAFAVLVERHGPVVLRVCREVLNNAADAEDAFQATFLVLVRRASTIRNRDSLASWLHGVALRVAASAHSAGVRRRVHEERTAKRAIEHIEAADDDLGMVIHEEVGQLPEKYRAAVVLCYLEGLTHEQAADRLRWPVGTVRSRLSWARQRLRSRLTRRGLAPALALSVEELATSAQAVPEPLVESTIRIGMQLGVGPVHPGAVETAAGVLAGGVIRTMMLVKWKVAALVLLTGGLMIAGASGIALQQADEPQAAVTTKDKAANALAPDQESPIDEQLRKLKAYRNELTARIDLQEKQWLNLAEDGITQLIQAADAMPDRAPLELEEYRKVRDGLFETNMKLIELEARGAEVDPELSLRRQIRDVLEHDREITLLTKEIEKQHRKIDLKDDQTRQRSGSSQVRQLEATNDDLRELIARKVAKLAVQQRDERVPALSLPALKAQMDSLKARKSSQETLLIQLQASNRKLGSVAARMALAREDLWSLREMRAGVEKRIEQLQYDSSQARPR